MAEKIHLIGIGGIGMSALAKCLIAKGCQISGSDLKKNELTRELENLGVKIFEGHKETNIDNGVTLVVRSAAVKDNNPEIKKAMSKNVEVVKYAQMLGKLSKEKSAIAISGCHGKTTTTAMIAYILNRAGLEPSFVCGGVIPQLKGNAGYIPGGRNFVVEACEYDRSFLNLAPKAAVITNIEEDHLDYYKDLSEITDAFKEFAALTPADGLVVGNLDNEISAEIAKSFKDKGETYSVKEDAHWKAKSIAVKEGRWEFEVLKYGKPYGQFSLEVPGIHNVSNALAAIAIANWAGVGKELIQVALAEFKGTERRFQILGEKGGVIVIDDYAHHPTEIQATLRAAREKYPDKKLWCVFQPHQHSRTRIMLKELAKSFADAHLVILPDIYYARDPIEDTKNISSQNLAKEIDAQGKAALYLASFNEVLAFLKDKAEKGSVLITMGAGNVGEIAHSFLSN